MVSRGICNFLIASKSFITLCYIFLSFILTCFHVFTECRGEEHVDQPDTNITEFEGRSVTLQCKYKTTSSQPELFWYIQRANDFPKYILWRNKYGTKDNDAQFQKRFDSEVESDSVPLTIKNLCVSDSAVYYCALRPTVTETNSTLTQKQRKCLII